MESWYSFWIEFNGNIIIHTLRRFDFKKWVGTNQNMELPVADFWIKGTTCIVAALRDWGEGGGNFLVKITRLDCPLPTKALCFLIVLFIIIDLSKWTLLWWEEIVARCHFWHYCDTFISTIEAVQCWSHQINSTFRRMFCWGQILE